MTKIRLVNNINLVSLLIYFVLMLSQVNGYENPHLDFIQKALGLIIIATYGYIIGWRHCDKDKPSTLKGP